MKEFMNQILIVIPLSGSLYVFWAFAAVNASIVTTSSVR